MTELYYIRNVGCDDETNGLAAISEEHLDLFREIVQNLNNNSQYDCMPVIELYKIDESFIRSATENDDPCKVLHMTSGNYVLTKAIEFYDRDTKEWKLAEGVERIF